MTIDQAFDQRVGARGEDATAATRYMCAGVHLDQAFAESVVQEIEEEQYRAFAPSYGVNIMIVHEHATKALARIRERDQSIGACLLLSFLLQPAVTVVLLVVAAFMGGDATKPLDPRSSRLARFIPGRRSLSVRVRAVSGAVARMLALFAVELLVATVAQALPAPLVYIHGLVLTTLITYPLLVLLPWVITWRERTTAWHTITGELTAASFHTKYRDTFANGPATDGNITVYSGYSPFVGSGHELRSWQLSMHLEPARSITGEVPHQREPWTVPVGPSGLIEGIAGQLAALGAETAGPADGIHGLSVTEKLFVDGTVLRLHDVRSSGLTTAVLPNEEAKPRAQVPDDLVQAYRGHHHGPIRHCLRIQVAAWGADLVLSVFVQVVISGGTLYLEVTKLLLPPIKEEFRIADSVAERNTVERLPAVATGSEEEGETVIAAQSVAIGLRALSTAPAAAFREFRTPARRKRRNADLLQAIRDDQTFDYGARLSLRELASGNSYRNYFQRVDVARISKLIDMRILDHLAGYLTENGLDISELTDRQTTILNSGILMTGGSMSGTIVAGESNTVSTGAGNRK